MSDEMGLFEVMYSCRAMRRLDTRAVPETLLSGDHAAIDHWRLEDSLIRTFLKRPDLLNRQPMDEKEKKILKKWCREIEALTTT